MSDPREYGCACRWIADHGQVKECASHAAVRELSKRLRAVVEELETSLVSGLERGGPNVTLSVSDLMAAVRVLKARALAPAQTEARMPFGWKHTEKCLTGTSKDKCICWPLVDPAQTDEKKP